MFQVLCPRGGKLGTQLAKVAACPHHRPGIGRLAAQQEVQGGKTVTIGCTVTLLDLTYDEEEEWTIVGTSEASFSEHKLSNDSPLAKAIIGKKKGSVAEVTDVAEPYKYPPVK